MNDPGPFRFDDPRRGKRYTLFAGAMLIGTLLAAVAAGLTGPRAIAVMSKNYRVDLTPEQHKVELLSSFAQMVPSNQFIVVQTRFALDLPMESEFQQTILVSVTGTKRGKSSSTVLQKRKELQRKIHCPREGNARYCRPVTLFTQTTVDFEKYDLNITFLDPECTSQPNCNSASPATEFQAEVELMTAQADFTYLEILYSWVFNAVTCAFLCAPRKGFLALLGRRGSASPMQKDILVLTAGVFFANDPLLAVRVFAARGDLASVLQTFHVICLSAFLSYLLYFVLTLLTGIWQREAWGAQRLGALRSIESREYQDTWRQMVARGFDPTCFSKWPKAMLCASLWFLMAGSYAYEAYVRTQDPTFQVLEDVPNMDQLVVAVLVLVGAYCAWLLYLVSTTICHAHVLPRPHLVVYYATLVTVVVTCVGLFLSVHYAPNTSIEFLLFSAAMNLYVWELLFVYAPLDTHEELLFGADDEDEAGGAAALGGSPSSRNGTMTLLGWPSYVGLANKRGGGPVVAMTPAVSASDFEIEMA